MRTWIVCLLCSLLLLSCQQKTEDNTVFSSEILKIKQISDHVFKHISYIDILDYGPFPCNGLVFIAQNEAMVFDTPTNNEASKELITWVKEAMNKNIVGVVVGHFHEDCLGGLDVFKEEGIRSYANELTISLAESNKASVPEYGFTDDIELTVGGELVFVKYFGEGHTPDNVVSYIPSEHTLFGGCLIKEMGAGKGNLTDANIAAWPSTVKMLKDSLPEVKIVVPGHGKEGGKELLDYTIKLFGTE